MGEKRPFGDDVRAAKAAALTSGRRGATSASGKRGLSLIGGLAAMFARKSGPPSAPSPFTDAALTSLYSVGASSDRSVSLGFLLRQSAHAIDRGRSLIAARGDELALMVAARASGDAVLAAHAARLVMALFWVFIGVVLTREASMGLAVRGLDAGSAAMLARIFVAVGILGAVAAFVGGFLVKAAAKRGAAKTDANFGAEAGAIARDYGATVEALRARIGDDNRDAAGDDVSRLHLVAVEAAAFFEGISFLTEPDHARAEEKFSAFLAGRPAQAGGGGGLLLILLGGVIGAGATVGVVTGGAARHLETGLPLWAVVALPGLAVLYAAIGGVFSLVGVSASGPAGAAARHEILTSLRVAYVAAGAPRADQLIDDVEAALRRSHTRITEAPPAAADLQSDNPWARNSAWTRPAEPPRFVGQTFDAAPPVFRPERQAGLRKNFFGERGRNADPKQTASAPDAPPWLKD